MSGKNQESQALLSHASRWNLELEVNQVQYLYGHERQ